MSKTLKSLNEFFERHFRYLLFIPALFFVGILSKIIFDCLSISPAINATKPNLDSGLWVNNIKIPEDINFCGEAIPYNDTLFRKNLKAEMLQRTFNQSKDLMLNKKANRWFKIIEPILKANKIPDDLKYIVLVESGFVNSPNAQNASGFWGLMIPVAQTYGLEINEEVDERFNIEKSTQAACEIFKDGYKKYKSWILVAAAYDMGSGALDNEIAKQKTTNYFQLNLNDETSNYIYRLLAFKELISHPSYYGYSLQPKDLFYPIPTNSIKVDSSISNLSTFAAAHQSNLPILKLMNPWLLKNSLANPQHKEYKILLPKTGVKLVGFETLSVDIDSLKIIIPNNLDSISKKLSDSILK